MRGWDVAALEPPLGYPRGALDSGSCTVLDSELGFVKAVTVCLMLVDCEESSVGGLGGYKSH